MRLLLLPGGSYFFAVTIYGNFFSEIIVCLGIGYLLDGKILEIPPLFS